MNSAKRKEIYFYTDKPLFGLDIGYSTLKAMQVAVSNKRPTVLGYGVISFDPKITKDSVIVEPQKLATVAREFFAKHIVGEINTRRVAVSIPTGKVFSRTIKLPKVAENSLEEAVRLEAEQYIPMPISDLYLDYSTITETDKETELLVMAAPRKIVDSYMSLIQLMGLEPVAFDTTISAASRLFVQADEQSDVPTVLIDFGSVSADVTIYDRAMVVTGTVAGGGDIFTRLIAKKLKVNDEEAHLIKIKYGLDLSKRQAAIKEALEPTLQQLTKEVRRMIRYYEERSGSQKKIKQIVTVGGGANLPGLSEYMTDQLRLPTRMCDPWKRLDFAGLQPPHPIEKSMYVTAAGLALLNPKEAFQS